MRSALAVLIASFLASACHSDETKACLGQFEQAQAVVRDVDSSKLESVERSLQAVESAAAACRKAERHHEADELKKAENQLSGHLAYMKRKANQREERALTPEQVEELVKKGDRTCPKGQAYKHRSTGKEIRCVGPQVIQMPLAQARAYFEGRGHKVTVTGTELQAEYGAERIKYQYGDPSNKTGAPRCVVIQAPPGMSWQESAARATGVPPNRVERDQPLRVGGQSLAFRVAGAQDRFTLFLGDCDR